jgi:hypothetical protein
LRNVAALSATLFFNMPGWFLDIFVEYLFRVSVRAVKLLRSRSWPVTKGTVLSADCPRASYGCTVATVYYEYIVDGKKYEAAYEKPFILRDSGAEYAGQFVAGLELKVRLKPGDPSVSVPWSWLFAPYR